MNTSLMGWFHDFDNMFANIDAMINYNRAKQNSLSSNLAANGLKFLVKRPHNLITVKNEDGTISGYKLEVVYTPFSKDDLKVEVVDGRLTVRCGVQNKVKDEEMDYCGISYQSYEFSLPLADTVETKDITAKAEEGMLRIYLPLKKVEPLPVEAPLQIAIS